MNTAIPSFQNTYVCEQCDFPSFDATEATLNLRNLRLDGACRDAFKFVATFSGADYVDVDGKLDEGAFCPNCAQSDYFASYNTQLRFKGLPSNVSAG